MNAAEQKKQDDYFQSNIQNLIVQANARTSPRFSLFLDERQRAMAEELLRRNRCMEDALFFGGAADCERVMLGVFPPELAPDPSAFPIAGLRISHKDRTPLSHRDYLGALMGLQIKREAVGDILPDDRGAVLFLSRELAEFVRSSLARIGRTAVEITPADAADIVREQAFEERTGTVPSLRLDCVTALAIRASRSEAARVVESGAVRVNGLEAENGAKQLNPGDKITVRGFGKFILGGELKRTKKDRIFITIKKYV